jgi:NAD(P)H dehydrogenase (quinone)
MPKLLVLFDARSDDIARLADAVADGARGVRFAEVDVRRVAHASTSAYEGEDPAARARPGSRHRVLESPDALAMYDGIVVGAPASGDDGHDAVRALLEESTANLANKVASAFTTATEQDVRRAALWALLIPMAERAMIIVPPRIAEPGDDGEETARKLGKRVTDVVGWITHARSHHHH